jgi:hypothetical protein
MGSFYPSWPWLVNNIFVLDQILTPGGKTSLPEGKRPPMSEAASPERAAERPEHCAELVGGAGWVRPSEYSEFTIGFTASQRNAPRQQKQAATANEAVQPKCLAINGVELAVTALPI